MPPVRRLVLVVLVAVACGASVVHAQTLSLTYTSGATYKYSLHSTADEAMTIGAMATPLKFELTGSETVTVNSVDSGGIADLEISLTNLTLKSTTGTVTNTTTGMPSPAIDMKIGPDGRIVSVNGNGSAAFGVFSPAGGGGFISAVLPDNAVKPGDTWSKDFDQANTLGAGSIHVATNSKYLRDESLQGVNAAVVQTTSTATYELTMDVSKFAFGAGSPTPPLPQGMPQSITVKGTSTSDVTSWIDPAGHRVIKSRMSGTTDASLNMEAAAGATMPGMPGSFTIKGKETTDISPA